MSRRRPARSGPVAGLIAVTLATAVCARPGPSSRPPGVVLVSIDTLRADRLGAYGYRARALTPALDQLAAEGILFEKHIAASPWTTPSHLSLFTSLSPTAHGVTASFNQLMEGLGHEGRFERLADEHETLAEALAARGWATAAFTGGITLDPRIGFGQGFDLYDTSMPKMTDAGFASLERWIRGRGDRPFFLFWHTFEVHVPYLHDDYVDTVVPADVARDIGDGLARLRALPDNPMPADQERALLEALGQFRPEVCSALYDGAVHSADRWVGRLVDVLRDAGLYDETLLVVTSDHGEQFGEDADEEGGRSRDGRFYNAHGHTVYDEMLRVPLIVRLPGGEHAGQRIGVVSRAIDVMPTVLDVVGLRETRPLQGTSLRPRWENGGGEAPPALSEALATYKESKSVRTDQYKYISSAGAIRVKRGGRVVAARRPNATELYDLVADPGERHNLLLRPNAGAEAIAQELAAMLRQMVGERRGRAEPMLLDEETLEQVRALGYLE